MMKSKTKKRLGPKKVDQLISELDLAPVLNNQVRQVRWLYHNSNKCTTVYDEKLVRIMIHRLQDRIMELETENQDIKENLDYFIS